MNLREFKQYLELLKYSGVEHLFTTFKDFSLKVNSLSIDPTQNEASSQIICPVPDVKKNQILDDDLGLLKIKENISDCNKCPLSKSRIKFVYGEGPQSSQIMIIGEAPGAEENITGRPFVGEAGKLLTKMLEAIQLDRNQLYICNAVKCRPPANRTPNPQELNTCFPYLDQQIRIIKPKVILLMGKVAIHTLLKKEDKIDIIRQNQPYQYQNIPVWTTYHPSALLHKPELKKLAWIDLQKFRDYLISANIK